MNRKHDHSSSDAQLSQAVYPDSDHEYTSTYEPQPSHGPESSSPRESQAGSHPRKRMKQQVLQRYSDYTDRNIEPTTLAQLGRNARQQLFAAPAPSRSPEEATALSAETAPASASLARKLASATACTAAALVLLAPLAQALSTHWPYFVAGGICASASHTAAVPLDVLKTRIQCAAPGEYRGTWDALVRILRSEGAQVLFCGAGATLVGYAMQGFLKVREIRLRRAVGSS